MKCLVRFIIVAVVLVSFSRSLPEACGDETGDRESVLDGVVRINDALVLDIPSVPRLCEAPGILAQNVFAGDCHLYCEREGAGTPIVLIHGGPGSTHHYFHPHFSKAAEWAQIVYYDQRGCGLSEYAAGTGYSVDQAVDDLDALREALGIQRWVVLGHSYGGSVAQRYAIKYPERLLGLVLVSSSFYGLETVPSGTRQYDFLTRAEREKIREIRADGSLSMVQSLFNSHLNGDWKRQSFYRPTRVELARMALYEWKHDPSFRRGILQSLNGGGLLGPFEEYPVPILIMEGKWDLTWTADKARKLHDSFPGSTLVVFDPAGHSPFVDVPSSFFPRLRAFVDGLQEVSEEAIVLWRNRLQDLRRE